MGMMRWNFDKMAPAENQTMIEEGQSTLGIFGGESFIEETEKQKECGRWQHTMRFKGEDLKECLLCGAKRRG